MADPCPYCIQRRVMEIEYKTTIGPCPLHAGAAFQSDASESQR